MSNPTLSSWNKAVSSRSRSEMPTRCQENAHVGRTMAFDEPTVFEQSVEGRRGYQTPKLDVPAFADTMIPADLLRKKAAALPELTETDITRHFTRLSSQNYAKDLGFYPLGSCTMKHNPKTANVAASLPAFELTHPLQDIKTAQGNLQICWEMQNYLAEISGMDAISLWPCAGSHGEFVSLLVIRAYHVSQGNPRKKVLIPDSAHGTNPASAAVCGYDVVTLKSGPDGELHPDTVRAAMDEEVAAIMITNPNTLGVFEENFKEISDIVHAKGGFVYCDGANLNALMGAVQLGKIGADCMHFNLHKTFAVPHGGGGPGAGPIGVVKKLEAFLPKPIIQKNGDTFSVDDNRPHSIGMIKSFWGNFACTLRAYAYIRQLGKEGITKTSQMAVLNAKYIRKRLEKAYHMPFRKPVLHECVLSDKIQNEYGIKTMDIAKRLMDYGFHPPTVYFPLIVPGALMIEPTETENKQQIDAFCDAMLAIADECRENAEIVKSAPNVSFRARLDEVRAAREVKVTAPL